MTDVQIFTIALAISTSFLAVFTGVFLNSNRLNDVKELLGAKIEAVRANVSKDVDVFRAETGARFDRIEAKLEKIDDNIARILADHEHRLTQLEGGKK